MRKITITTIIAIILAIVSSSVFAGVRNCTSALVTAGLCTSATDVLLSYSLPTVDPDGAGPRVSVTTQVQEGCALWYGYQATINGSPNPESKALFCDRMIRMDVLKRFADIYYNSLAETLKQTQLTATPTDTIP